MWNWVRGHEAYLAWAALVTAIILGVTSGLVSDQYRQSVLIELMSTMLGLSLGLFLVNVYLERRNRRDAVRPLLALVAPSIQRNHNDLLSAAWGTFGKPQFGELLRRYMGNNGDPQALSPAERDSLYGLVKGQLAALQTQLDRLDADLRELTYMLGWSFKPTILRSAFACRHSIQQLRLVTFDDSAESKLRACEHFLDVDIHAFSTFNALVELLEVPKHMVYKGYSQ
jgi:hypothetical protein